MGGGAGETSEALSWFVPKGHISGLTYSLTRGGKWESWSIKRVGHASYPCLDTQAIPEAEITMWSMAGEEYQRENLYLEY